MKIFTSIQEQQNFLTRFTYLFRWFSWLRTAFFQWTVDTISCSAIFDRKDFSNFLIVVMTFEFSRINKVLEQNYCTKMPLMITYWWILALVTKPTSLFTFLSCSTSRSRLELDTLNRVHKWWYCSSLFRPTTITPSIYCWLIIVVFI